MKHIRWYDKNPDLNEVFEFIESLNPEYQSTIAKDIMQILIQDFNLDWDTQINNISKNYNYDCKRWYDNNIDLFTSFEIIRGLPADLQQKIVEKITSTILLVYFDENKGLI